MSLVYIISVALALCVGIYIGYQIGSAKPEQDN